MEILQKSRKLRKPRKAYAYMVLEKNGLCTVEGEMILLGGQKTYVCGGCLLLLESMEARSSLLSPSKGRQVTQNMQTTLLASSSDGCELFTLWHSQSLFPKFPHEEESTFMGYYLICHQKSVISAKINALFPWVEKGKQERSQISGERALLMFSKLTVLTDWQVTSPST